MLRDFGYISYNPSISICNMFSGCLYETCTWVPLPRLKTPTPLSAPSPSPTKLYHYRSLVTQDAQGFYLIETEEELEIEMNTSCIIVLDEVRSYPDLNEECSLTGTCEPGNINYRRDYSCHG